MKCENTINIEYPTGVFADTILQFLDYKRALGYKYNDSRMYITRKILIELNNYNPNNIILTKEMVEQIISLKNNEKYHNVTTRATILRQLGLFMRSKGYEAYVIPKKSITFKRITFKAFIYSDDEITNLISTCDDYCKNSKFLSVSSKITYPFLLRLLYSCGLRISEVLKLKKGDIHLEDGFIQINDSKCGKSRIVPVSDSMIKCLKQYDELIVENKIKSLDGSYFTSIDGQRISKSAASRMIKIWIKLCIERKTSQDKYPRIHDLRHTAAVRILENLDNADVDLNVYLPLLSTFLGHHSISETEQYLQYPSYNFKKINSLGLFDKIIPNLEGERNER